MNVCNSYVPEKGHCSRENMLWIESFLCCDAGDSTWMIYH